MCHVNVVVVVVVVTTPRSGNFPYFRTVRGVLPAKSNGLCLRSGQSKRHRGGRVRDLRWCDSLRLRVGAARIPE